MSIDADALRASVQQTKISPAKHEQSSGRPVMPEADPAWTLRKSGAVGLLNSQK